MRGLKISVQVARENNVKIKKNNAEINRKKNRVNEPISGALCFAKYTCVK